MAYLTLTLITISVIILISLYIGIWGSVLDSFSDEKIRNDFLIASRLTQYEQARLPTAPEPFSPLAFFKEAEKLSERQREIFKEILDGTNRKLIAKLFLLLIFIAWGSVYLSHKIAGPLYRFHATLEEIEKGNLAIRIRLRKFDEAQFLADRFNHTIENLDFTFSRLKNILRENETNARRLTERFKEELSKIKTSADK
jgi:methyl-accepting chemotaxis protein